MHAATAAKWAQLWKATLPSNNYNEPLVAPESWWEDARVRHSLVTYGTEELLRDPIERWAEKYRAANQGADVRVVRCEKDGHCAPIYAEMLGEGVTETERVVEEWVRAVCRVVEESRSLSFHYKSGESYMDMESCYLKRGCFWQR